MRYAGPAAGRPGLLKKREKGQALIYGLFVLMSGLAALFFLFNTGQLSREKTKLVNTADAVAYSAGVMHARTLNFEAYTNRAMVANTVAIAQLVSLSSWIQYTSNLATFGGAVAGNPKFVMFYPSYFAALYSGPYLETALNESTVLENLAKASDNIIQNILMKAQSVAYAGLVPARTAVLDEVAKANYHDDGVVTVESVLPAVTDFPNFVQRQGGEDRARFAEVAKASANKDGFLPKRSWSMPALWADCATAFPRVDWMDRRGGTELVSFDEWKAIDTLSEKEWTPRDKFDPFCSAIAEVPMGWGSRTAADSPTIDPDPTHYDSSIIVNPGPTAAAIATSSAWGYKGLPSFYDLSPDALAQDDPRLKFAIRVRRDKSQTVTSEGRSAISPTPRLNAYTAKPAGGNELVAVSTSEVFFERAGDAKDNEYGKSLSRPREIGSLFNPYWQVRLIHSADDIKKAQTMQGAVLP